MSILFIIQTAQSFEANTLRQNMVTAIFAAFIDNHGLPVCYN